MPGIKIVIACVEVMINGPGTFQHSGKELKTTYRKCSEGRKRVTLIVSTIMKSV